MKDGKILNNFFDKIPSELKEEYFEDLIKTENLQIERIISKGHSSPKNFWYDQETNEFVLLLKGGAKLVYDNGKEFDLAPGDYLLIPAHQKHRVEWTDESTETFWLAIHFN